jgi:flagellin-like hook-associated protein FlgL
LSGDGNTIVFGAYNNNDGGVRAGHARVFRWDGENWNQIGLDIDGQAGDISGENTSISRDGNTIAIGARLNGGNGDYSGAVRVFRWGENSWSQLGQDIQGEAVGDQFGSDVSLSSDGNFLAAGAFLNDGNGNDSGHARVFAWDGNEWNQVGQDIDGEAVDDKSGNRVRLSSDGSVIAVSAADNDGKGFRAGHVRIFENDSISSWRDSSMQSNGVSAIDVTQDASKALETITFAIEQVSGQRAEYGALQNRLEYTVSNLMNVSEFTTAARSRIEDADFAAESARLAKAQVLQQTGTAMLAQANSSSQLVLSLVR